MLGAERGTKHCQRGPDRHGGRTTCDAGCAAVHPQRQRTEVRCQGDSALTCPSGRGDALHRARHSVGKRLCGIVPQPFSHGPRTNQGTVRPVRFLAPVAPKCRRGQEEGQRKRRNDWAASHWLFCRDAAGRLYLPSLFARLPAPLHAGCTLRGSRTDTAVSRAGVFPRPTPTEGQKRRKPVHHGLCGALRLVLTLVVS